MNESVCAPQRWLVHGIPTNSKRTAKTAGRGQISHEFIMVIDYAHSGIIASLRNRNGHIRAKTPSGGHPHVRFFQFLPNHPCLGGYAVKPTRKCVQSHTVPTQARSSRNCSGPNQSTRTPHTREALPIPTSSHSTLRKCGGSPHALQTETGYRCRACQQSCRLHKQMAWSLQGRQLSKSSQEQSISKFQTVQLGDLGD
jgi:hypothetical protein